MNYKATDRCFHCHCEFADHNYIKDSIDKYQCPKPSVTPVYGFFLGGDPRDFSPDFESNSEEEIAAWKADCERWNKAEKEPSPEPCLSGFVSAPGFWGHILRSQYGIGMNLYKETLFFEPIPDGCVVLDLDDFDLD